MTLFKLVAAFIRRRPLTWAFHALTLSLGVAVLTAILTLNSGLSGRFQRDLGGIDLVVGAKGSPLQLILSSVFQLDQPTGNIPLATLQTLSQNRLVARATPISLGDNVSGFRIVGTTSAYGDIYGAHLAAGGWWSQPMQAVVGASVAQALKLKVGDVFVGDHGLAPGGEAHRDTPYRVVGVLAPTGAVIDRVVLTDTASVWRVHEHEAGELAGSGGRPAEAGGADKSPAPRQVTAILIRYRSAMGALMLPRYIAAMPDLQAASPAVETAHLTTLLGAGADVFRAFGLGLLALSALGFFVALYSAVSQRRGELALLRALGAHPSLLFALVAVEGLALGLCGGLAGLGLGRGAAVYAAMVAVHGGGPSLPLPPFGLLDLAILAGALALSLAASIAPGLVAYRTHPAATLRGG